MNRQELVEEDRAAVLLGLPMAEIRRFSRISGLGHLEKGDQGEHSDAGRPKTVAAATAAFVRTVTVF